jgi:lipopolysaccharide transport system ATP-binding protein
MPTPDLSSKLGNLSIGSNASTPISSTSGRTNPGRPQPATLIILDWQNESAGFGSGDEEIVSVRLITSDRRVPTWITGSESLLVTADVEILREIASPILDFNSQYRLRQRIFGDDSLSSGTFETHTQGHWTHDALFFDVHSPH